MRAWHDGAGKAWKDAKDADMIWFDVGWDGLRVENISWRGHSCWEKPPPARQPAGCGQIYTVKATVKPFGHEQCHRFECTVFSLMLPAPTGRWCRKKKTVSHPQWASFHESGWSQFDDFDSLQPDSGIALLVVFFRVFWRGSNNIKHSIPMHYVKHASTFFVDTTNANIPFFIMIHHDS